MEGGKEAEGFEGSWQSPKKGQSLTTSTAPNATPDEASAVLTEEPVTASQESRGVVQKASEVCTDSSIASPVRVCCDFTPPCRMQPALHCCCEPSTQKQDSWEALQVPEPGAPGLPWTPVCQIPPELPPRGQCLIHNWVEERATNELDRVLNREESEGYRFRHGHVGLLTLELSSPQTSRTTQKDSYQHPGDPRKALRGKKEAMLELLLHHEIRKEVKQAQGPPYYCNYESVTHHDYQRKLEQPCLPPPTKPHSLMEQPETFWLQNAKQLPGVSNIRTYDTPFRKNCSFSTPVPLSLEQPLPYNSAQYPPL
ncbi:sperm-associated antigen 8 isoform X1 [Monodelphis domestica]|uniref:sperm-associated antigen 8 isoform X1 n=1 Tax=Monodelphis domestica TaxID=13616 RepID=UPI0000F2DBEA|nr:sperm-associated antigen 8 isoform X1 [Monodelphis domestica]